jgi:signal transduction histidine kinase
MAAHPRPLAAEQLYDLAPPAIASYRSLRYDGGAMGATLADFPPADRDLLGRIYAGLQATFALLRDEGPAGEQLVSRLGQLYADTWEPLLPAVRNLGAAIPIEQVTPRLGQIIHDVKGGAFQALVMHLQLIGLGITSQEELHRVYFLARDQLKIMRNALPEIDPAGTARDEEQRLHAVELLTEKWNRSQHRLAARAATVEVDCRFSGAIAERCLEFSALDRVIYNLVNNAVAHSADGRVALAILPLPADQPRHIRIAVANAVSPEQRRALEARFPTGPGQLFHGGFSTTGSGLGLRICADFVCNAYGLASVDQGLAEGHLGVAFLAGQFVAWVHWPIAAD